MTKTSAHPFAETVERLKNAITAGGNVLFGIIDQAKAAADVGLSLRPTMLILFGNPKGGTPLMEAFPLVALDLPLKVLVWQDDTAVHVAYTPASEIAAHYGVTGMNERIAAMDAALEKLTSLVA